MAGRRGGGNSRRGRAARRALSNEVRNWSVSSLDDCDTTIKISDKVRSYDFEHSADCYVEGEVVGKEDLEGCTRYKIRAERKVVGGVERPDILVRFYYPPVNGTCYAGRDGFTNFVRKI